MRIAKNQQKNSFSEFLESSRITSDLVVFLFCANIIISGYLVDAPSNRQIGISWHLIDFANAGISLSSLIFLRFIIKQKKNLNSFEKFIYLLGACVPGILVSPIIIYIVTQKVPAFIFLGIPVGIISNISSLFTITILVTSIIDTRKAMRIVRDRRTIMGAINDSMKLEINSNYNAIKQKIQNSIAEIVTEIESEIDKTKKENNEKSELIRKFKRSIDEIIRPLSQEIDSSSGSIFLGNVPTIYTKSSVSGFFRNRIHVQIAINPFFLGTFLISIVLPSYFFLIDLKAMFTLGVPAIIAFMIFVVYLRKLFRKGDISFIQSLLVSVGVTIVVGAIFIVINRFFGRQYDVAALSILSNAAILVTLSTSIATTFLGARSQFIFQEDLLNNEILEVQASARQNLWAFRRKVSRILHGEVQRHLQASLFKLTRAPEMSRSLLTEVQSEINSLQKLVKFDEIYDDVNFSESLAILKDLWAGICEIEIQIKPEVVDALNDFTFSRDCALEVINEAVTNSIKHGDARIVKLEARIINNDIIELKITNENPRLNLIYNSDGLGKKIMDEVALSWKSEIVDSKYILTALINLVKISY